MGNLRLRRVHKIDTKARRHAAGGAGGGLSRAAGQQRGHQDEGEGGEGHVLLHLIQCIKDLCARAEIERINFTK